MRTEAQIRADMEPFELELHQVREAARAKEQKALIGKCFKYRNNYGSTCPGWWLYSKVVKSGEHWPECFTFEVTSKDIIEVKYKDRYHGAGNWQEITAKEFNAEWRKVQKLIAGLKP